jgi:hypothetical protein
LDGLALADEECRALRLIACGLYFDLRIALVSVEAGENASGVEDE